MEKMKVIFHIDEMEKWSLTLINVRNLLRDSEEEVEIEVHANSPAVKGFTPDFELAHVIAKQNGKGVKFGACKNALEACDLGESDILEFVRVVPNSMVELIQKQREGFAYIRP